MLNWLTSLPAIPLILAIGAIAAIENFFPPIPSDLAAALAGVLAAQRGDSPVPVLVAVLTGGLGGAFAMYALGRRFGAAWLGRRLGFHTDSTAERRIRTWYERYGLMALFVSRFLPGVRAIVPPLAGALRVPVIGAVLSMGTASALWYSVVIFLGFRAGSRWAALQDTVARYGAVIGIVAGALVVVGLGAWWARRRANRTTS